MITKILMIVVFVAVTIYIGFYSRKKAQTTDGYILGGRSVGPWLSAFAYGTSYFSAVIFVGYAGQFGWKFGVAALWIGIGNALIGSLLAWVVLGKRTRVMSHKLDSSTMPDFFGKRFKSNGLRIMGSIIIFIFLIPYTASLYNGLSRIFAVAFNIDFNICIIVMAAVTAVYVILGGFVATAINDFIQGIIMIGGIIAVVVAVLNLKGGFNEAMNLMLQVENTNGVAGYFGSMFGPDPVGLLMVVVFTSFGTWGLPQMVQKFYAIKDERQIKKGTIISTIFALVVAGGCYFLGGFGRLFADVASYNPTTGAIIYDSIVPAMVNQLPTFLIAVVIVLVLAASMSTLSSLVLASSSTITVDLIKPYIAKEMKQKGQVLTLRILTVVFIIISAVIAIVQSTSSVTFIAQLMGISWGAIAGAFLAPFLFGLYWRRTTKISVWVTFITAPTIMVINLFFAKYLPVFFKSPINCGVIAMGIGLILVPVISLITKKPDTEMVDDLFAHYDKTKAAPVAMTMDESVE